MDNAGKILIDSALVEKVAKSGRFMVEISYIDQDELYRHELVRVKFPLEEMRRSHKETGKLVEAEIQKVLKEA